MSEEGTNPQYHEVIAPFINEPTEYFRFKEIRSRFGSSDTPIREKLRDLVEVNVLEGSRALGRPPKRKDEPLIQRKRGRKEGLYKIKLNADAFQKVLSFYSDDIVKEFFQSKYCDEFIKQYTLAEVYKLVQSRLKNPEFKRIASSSLLNLSASKKEYKKLSYELNKKMLEPETSSILAIEEKKDVEELSSYLTSLAQNLNREPIEEIEVLSGFEPLHAVKFYRSTINKPLTKAYGELAKRSAITEGLASFLAFDNYLSPLTAHPVNSIAKILFTTPFERIFEDAYLQKGEAFRLLSGRAAAIHSSFSDFLFEFLGGYPLTRNDMKILTKEMIYSWNVASTRFDLVCHYLSELYDEKRGSGNYHLKRSGLNFNIIDLESGISLLRPEISSSLLIIGSIPRKIVEDEVVYRRHNIEIMDKPFTVLRPCANFEDMEFESRPIQFKEIFDNLEKKYGY